MTPSGSAAYALALLFLVNLLNYLDRQILFALFPLIQSDLRLTDTQLGLLGSAFMIVYLIAAPMLGLLGDRRPRPALLGWGIALWSLATALSGIAKTFWHLLAARATVGIGEASYGSIAPALLADWYSPERRGRVLALFFLAIPAGSALGYLMGGLLGPWTGWRAAFLLVGLPGLLAAYAVSRLPDPPRGGREGVPPEALAAYQREPLPLRSALVLFKTRSYVLNTLAMAAMTFALGGLAAWVPTFLVRVKGLELGAANIGFSGATLLAGILGTLLGGWLGDRLLRRTSKAYPLVAGAGLLGGIPFVLLALYAEDPLLYWPAIFLAEVLIFLNTSPLNAVIVGVTLPRLRATAFAVNIFVIHALGDALSPALIGVLSDQTDLRTALLLAPAFLLLAGGLCFFTARHIARDTAAMAQNLRRFEARQPMRE